MYRVIQMLPSHDLTIFEEGDTRVNPNSCPATIPQIQQVLQEQDPYYSKSVLGSTRQIGTVEAALTLASLFKDLAPVVWDLAPRHQAVPLSK